MIRQVIKAAAFRRDAYLRAVLTSHGVADAVVVVAATYIVLMFTVSHRAVADVLGHARFLLDGAIAWLIVSGVVYLIARHLLHGEGSYQGVVAMSGLAHPVLALMALARLGPDWPLMRMRHPTLMIFGNIWDLGTLQMLIVILATVWFLAILAAGTRVAMSLATDRAVMAVGAGYAAWWVIGSILRF